MSAPEVFPIGILSKRSGVNIESIRYYERVDLLRKPARSTGGYRLYRSGDIDRLCFIRRARDLGFSLDEIRRLLELGVSLEPQGLGEADDRRRGRVRAAGELLGGLERGLVEMIDDVAGDLLLRAGELIEPLGDEVGERLPARPAAPAVATAAAGRGTRLRRGLGHGGMFRARRRFPFRLQPV